MEAVAYILGAILSGLLVGAVARFIVPGRDPMSIFQTMLVGVAGSIIAGLITYYVFDRQGAAGLILSVICAAALVFAIRKLRERQLGEAAPAREGYPTQSQAAPFGGGMQVRFMPGCLITSLLLSLFLTVVLNLMIRAF